MQVLQTVVGCNLHLMGLLFIFTMMSPRISRPLESRLVPCKADRNDIDMTRLTKQQNWSCQMECQIFKSVTAHLDARLERWAILLCVQHQNTLNAQLRGTFAKPL